MNTDHRTALGKFAIGTIAALAAILVAGAGCLSEHQMLEAQLAKPSPLPPSKQCPPPGSYLPFSQIWTDAPHLVGCDVTSDVVLLGAAGGCPQRLVARSGDRCFGVSSTNEYNPNGTSPQHMLDAPQSAVSALFQLRSGTPLKIRGVMAVDEDLGVLAFVASGVQVAQTSPPQPAPTGGPAKP